jgi:hypothetical protein
MDFSEFEKIATEKIRNDTKWRGKFGRVSTQYKTFLAIWLLHENGYPRASRCLVKELTGFQTSTLKATLKELSGKKCIKTFRENQSRKFNSYRMVDYTGDGYRIGYKTSTTGKSVVPYLVRDWNEPCSQESKDSGLRGPT